MATMRLLLFLSLYSAGIHVISSLTDPNDAAVLMILRDSWKNTPSSWENSTDPCGVPWKGVSCTGARVTALRLSAVGLIGKLSSSYIGALGELTSLILAGCSFSGTIPEELGNLEQLSFLALNTNNFTGRIPPSLGKLSNLYWLDVADNRLTGPLPISTSTSPGLDLLLKAKHFHLNKNQLSGSIPLELFSSEMILIHALLDENNFTGSIPVTLGLVKTLEMVRLNRNALTGSVPSNLNNLTNVNELNLANNKLAGPLPDLTGMNSLNYVDLSNNSFDPSEAPLWFSTLPTLTTLVIEYGPLQGTVPEKLFSLPNIQQVKLKNNAFNGTLNLGDSISAQLDLVDLQNNQISLVTMGYQYKNSLLLAGNPVCNGTTGLSYCQIPQTKTYSTNVSCGNATCPQDQKLSPQSCQCEYPFEGTLYFREPTFRDLSDANKFHSLETSLWSELGLNPGSVDLENLFFNTDDYLQIQLALFPSTGTYFNSSEILRIGFDLSNQTYKQPQGFGPYYYFTAAPYTLRAHNEFTFTYKGTRYAPVVYQIVLDVRKWST